MTRPHDPDDDGTSSPSPRPGPPQSNAGRAGAPRADRPATHAPEADAPSAGAQSHLPEEGPRDRAKRHRQAYEFGAQLRALRGELDSLRDQLHDVSGRARTDRDNLTETTGYVAELLPRVRDLEDQLAALRAAHLAASAPGATAAGDPGGPAGGGADPDTDAEAPVPTPATGWDDMDRATAAAAWAALAEFVAEVLYRQYQLTRLQVPDCWPLHPRMVRELAWLRASYLEAVDAEPDVPSAAVPWHTRWLPGFFDNTANAVDARECRPGVHRLTEPEVDHYIAELTAARQDGRPDHAPTSHTGYDRPRWRPEHFPTRSTSTARRGSTPTAVATIARPPKPEALADLLIDGCHPRYWSDYHHEASTADLDNRPD